MSTPAVSTAAKARPSTGERAPAGGGSPGPRARAGRRGAEADTRADILVAARKLFGEKGFRSTTMRSIAAAAGVDVALLAYYFGTKDGLFAAALDLPVDPRTLIDEAFAQGPD